MPTKPVSHVPAIVIDDNLYADGTVPLPQHNFKTGNQIPAESSRKLTGKLTMADATTRLGFRFPTFNTGRAPSDCSGNCYTAGTAPMDYYRQR